MRGLRPWRLIRIFGAAALSIAPLIASVSALAEEATSKLGSWNMPLTLADSNTVVKFEVGSTWHTIHGTTSGIKGALTLAEETDPTSIKGTVEIPVARFDTDNSRRDQRMLEVMAAERFATVSFKVEQIANLCNPSEINVGKSCKAKALGKLMIRGVERPSEWLLEIERVGEEFHIHGGTTIRWADFAIEDPSILVAKLYPDVKLQFDLKVGAQAP